MSIISKETWDKFTQEEKYKVIKDYNNSAVTVRVRLEAYFGKENLQSQLLTYEDVEKKLKETEGGKEWVGTYFADKVNTIVMLLEVAKFLNKDWKPDWEKVQEDEERIYGIGIDPPNNNEVLVFRVNPDRISTEIVYFRTEELAKQAVAILGKDVIRLALTTEY